MHHCEPPPCTPAAFRVGEIARPWHGVVSGNDGPPPGQHLEASLGDGWGARLFLFLWCDAVLLHMLHDGGCPALGTVILGCVLAGGQLLALLLVESDVDFTVLPPNLLLVTFHSALRERCLAVPASSVRAVALVEDPDSEHRTFRAHLLFHGRNALDLGTMDDTAVRVADLLQLPLERYSPALPPDIRSGRSATLSADA